MEIININKYISLIENNNIILYFYKKKLYAVQQKEQKILYTHDKNKNSLFDNIDFKDYKIIETNIKDLENKINVS